MKQRILFMTSNAMLLAFIIIMGFFPQVGFIQLLPSLPAFTLIHIPVLIGAYFNGWKGGIFYGIAFGLVSLLQAMLNPGPLNVIFLAPEISILPRFLFGLTSGGLFWLLKKQLPSKWQIWFIAPTAFLLTLIHTVLVLSAIAWFIGPTFLDPFTFESVIAFIQPIVLLNGMGEAFLAFVLVPLVIIPITRLKLYNRG
jgi:uncharacterized membrane protein